MTHSTWSAIHKQVPSVSQHSSDLVKVKLLGRNARLGDLIAVWHTDSGIRGCRWQAELYSFAVRKLLEDEVLFTPYFMTWRRVEREADHSHTAINESQTVRFPPPTILDRGSKWNSTGVNKCASAVFGRFGVIVLLLFITVWTRNSFEPILLSYSPLNFVSLLRVLLYRHMSFVAALPNCASFFTIIIIYIHIHIHTYIYIQGVLKCRQ